MEEDIKVLEERINFCKNNKECREELKQCFGCTFEVEEIQAIENLIKGYKELEKKYTNILSVLNESGLKTISLVNDVNENYIPKSKVREKIEEYRYLMQNPKEAEHYVAWYGRRIDILQELLQDEE